MYLYARLFGISCYLILYVTFLISLIKMNKKDFNYILLFFFFFFLIIAYFYEPAPEADLYRIRLYIGDVKDYKFLEMLDLIHTNSVGLSASPIGAMMFWLIGQIGNLNLVSFFSFMITFGIIFSIIYNEVKEKNYSNHTIFVLILCLFAMDYYMPTIATVRSYIASSVIFLAIYLEQHNNKIKIESIVLYVCGCLFHSVGLIFVCIKIIYEVIKYIQHKDIIHYLKNQLELKDKKTMYIIFGIACAMLIILFLLRGIIFGTVTKAINYITNNEAYSYSWGYLCLAMMLIIQAFTIYKLKDHREELKEQKLNIYYDLSIVFLLFMIIFCWQYAIFQRFSFFITLLEVPLILYVNSIYDFKDKYMYRIYLLLPSILFVITITRGYLCSLKFW